MRMYARVNAYGVAMAEAALCETHHRQPWIEFADTVADGADDVGEDRTWHDCTGNMALACVECGLWG